MNATNLPLPNSSDYMDRLCEVMHDAYEAAALSAGWQTQERSRVPWADVPEANKATMRAAVAALLRELGGEPVSTTPELYAVLLHAVWADMEAQRATVIRSTDGGETWHEMAEATRDYADEIAGALQWCAEQRARS